MQDNINDKVTVPVRGIRLHLCLTWRERTTMARYCPREGYKVASQNSGVLP